MSEAEIGFGDLIGHAVRNQIGERTIGSPLAPVDSNNPVQKFVEERIPWLAKTVAPLWNAFNALNGWLTNLHRRFLSFTFTEAWGLFLGTASFIMNFDFNVTDEELDKQFNQRINGLAGRFGELTGCALGFAVCGLGGTAIIFKINKTAALRVADDVIEESFEELGGEINSLGRYLFQTAAEGFLRNEFKNSRRFVKRVAANPAIKKYLPSQTVKFLDQWGKEPLTPWTFNTAIDDLVEKIPSKPLQNFTEELIDSFKDCCSEIGYVIAQSLDSYRAEQRDLREAVIGVQRTVQVTPNRSNPNETYYLSGGEHAVRPAITNLIAQHQMIEYRDIGLNIGGIPISEYALTKASPKTVSLRLIYYPTPDGSKSRSLHPDVQVWRYPDYEIPYVNPAKLDWSKIKKAMGGVDGFRWGRYRAYGWIEGRKIEVRGATEAEAVERLEEFADLSLYELQSTGTSHKGTSTRQDRALNRRQQPQRVYPAYCYVMIRRREVDADDGRVTIQGSFTEREYKIPLWHETELDYVKPLLAELQTQAVQAYASHSVGG